MGMLPKSGNGTEWAFPAHQSIVELFDSRIERNAAILRRLGGKEDANSEELLQKTLTEATLGRMSPPLPVSDEAKTNFLLAPRWEDHRHLAYVSTVCICVTTGLGSCKAQRSDRLTISLHRASMHALRYEY